MKKISKLLIAFILIILCSGCTINYNLEITEDNIKETIEVNDTEIGDRTKEKIYKEYNRWFPVYINASEDGPTNADSSIKADGIEYHEKSIQELENGYFYTYKYTYPIEKFHDASTLRQAFTTRNAYVGENYLVIRTDKNNLLCNYSYFESLKVNIKVDTSIYKLKNTNADEINKNTYTWYLDKNNCSDSEIILTLDEIEKTTNNITNNVTNNEQNNNKKNNDYSLYIFLGILLIIMLSGYAIFNKIKDKNNKMDI